MTVKRATRTLAMMCILYAGVANAQSLEQIEAYERRIDEQQQQLDAMREELEALKKMAGMQTAAKEEPEPAKVADVVEEDAGREPFVVSRSDNSVLTLGGRVHRVIMQVDDGASTNGFFMDSDQGPTMLRADISSRHRIFN